MTDLLVVGDANPEVLLYGALPAPPARRPETLMTAGALALGGSAAIVAHGAARLGLSVALVAMVGRDPAGDFVLDTLSTAGVDIRGCVRHETLPTALTVRLDRVGGEREGGTGVGGERVGGTGVGGERGGGERASGTGVGGEREGGARVGGEWDGGARSTLTTPGCLPAFDPRQVRLPRAGHLHVASCVLPSRMTDALPSLFGAFAGTTSLDAGRAPAGPRDLPNWRAPACDLVFADEAEALAVTGAATLDQAMRRLGGHGRVPVVRRANGDAVAIHAEGRTTAVGPYRAAFGPYRACADPAGAGDSFTAGFLARWLHTHEVPAALAFGCACGLRSGTRAGATAGQPFAYQAQAALGGIRLVTEPRTPPSPRRTASDAGPSGPNRRSGRPRSTAPRPHPRPVAGGALLPIQRRRAILAILATEHEVGTARLAARFGVSAVTIRRDLGQLHEEGRLERVRGGGRPR